MAIERFTRHNCELPEEVEEGTYIHCKTCEAVYVGARYRVLWLFETAHPEWIQVESWPEAGYVKERDEHLSKS